PQPDAQNGRPFRANAFPEATIYSFFRRNYWLSKLPGLGTERKPHLLHSCLKNLHCFQTDSCAKRTGIPGVVWPSLTGMTTQSRIKSTIASVLVGWSVMLAGAAETNQSGRLWAPGPKLQLWYNQPAEKWTSALPVGNGRMGAMI